MKPLPFDMTPLAKALEMPTTITDSTMDKQAVTTDLVAAYPEHLSKSAGWLSSLANEQIHALATHVLAHHSEQGLRTLAVTSALADEGKTTLVLAMAEKLASADKRVLIIDLDTHRGTLSHQAELGTAAGAMEASASRNGKPVPFHCYTTDCKGVSIMPTGHWEMEGTDVPLLDPDRVTSLVQRGLEEFDLVILDCPPLLPVADTHVIGDVADRAILVVRANSTPRPILEQAIKEFGSEKFFAAILNRAQPHFIPYFREVYGYYRRTPR